jgi:hypothetical protein
MRYVTAHIWDDTPADKSATKALRYTRTRLLPISNRMFPELPNRPERKIKPIYTDILKVKALVGTKHRTSSIESKGGAFGGTWPYSERDRCRKALMMNLWSIA